MPNLFRELRRREVFRTAGLYVGIAWIGIEAASVFLPAFDAPDWVMRALIIIAIIGLPVVIVLAWIFDITDHGIEVQGDPTDTIVAPIGGRKMDFAVIGVLAVALIFSVYLNFTMEGSGEVEAMEPISVLIADFDNQTGDPLFEGSLEQALQIGMEGASFITSYRRDLAGNVAAQLQSSTDLDAETSRLVAVREGIKLVLAGSIVADGDGYELAVSAIEPRDGEVIAEADANADAKLQVLTAMEQVAGDLRRQLGDESQERGEVTTTETFTAKSLEAVREYVLAQSLSRSGQHSEAIDHYKMAIDYDPDFGRAYSGWAIAARGLGRGSEAEAAWDKALALIETMTERERLRTLGIYYYGVTRNYQKAIETYETLVQKYPADSVGHNNLAINYFAALDFQNALREGRVALEIYPNDPLTRSNYALYAMYASDFETAVTEAETLMERDDVYFKAWLPLAMAAMAAGDLEAARSAYRSMSEAGARGASTASLGLADVEIFAGNFNAASEILKNAISSDEATNNAYGVGVKQLALAEALLAQGETALAISAATEGLEAVRAPATLVPAALIYASAGDNEKALEIANSLAQQLSPQSHAYAGLIEAVVALESGDHLAAINRLTAAIQAADLWLLRFYQGRAYLEGGYYVEALDEFTAAADRHGEATALFLDDLPTYRAMSTLPDWIARAQAELGMTDDAQQRIE